MMVRNIKSWIQDDTKYVITSVAMSALNLLQKHPCLTVSGNAGSGKTACIRHIALDLMAQGYELVPVIEPKTIIDYHDESKKQAFIFDDACGVHTVDKRKRSDWLDYGQIIQDCLKQSGSLLLVSVRLSVCKSELFQDIELLSKNVIGFKDEKYELSIKNRQDIFESYFKKTFKEFGIDDQTILLHDSFPLLCRMSSSSLHTVTDNVDFSTKLNNEKRDLVSFFKTPFKIIEDEVESMIKNSPVSYCLLVLCVLFNGNLPKHDVFNTSRYKHRLEDCFSLCGLNTGTSSKFLTDIATAMTGVYFKDVGGDILFIHDIVMDVVAASFGKKSPNTLLKYAGIEFIINRVKLERFTKTSNVSEKNTILIPESHHISFFDRLYVEIQNGNAWQVFSHCQLEIPEVQKQMIKYLKTKSDNDLRYIFFQVQDKKAEYQMQKLRLKLIDISAQMLNNQPVKIENPLLLDVLANTAFEWIIGKGLLYLIRFVNKRLCNEVYNELTKTGNICRLIAVLGGDIYTYSLILSIQKRRSLWQKVRDTLCQNEYSKHDFLWAVITGQTEIVQHLRQIDCSKICIKESVSYTDIIIICLRLFRVSHYHLKMMMLILKIMKLSTIFKLIFMNENVDLNRQLSSIEEMFELFFTEDECFNDLIIQKFQSEIQPVISRNYLHIEEQLLFAGFSLQHSCVFDIKIKYLEIASMLGHESVVNLLLRNGANPNELTSQTKNIARQHIALPIARTVLYGRLQVMKTLLKHGAKIESTGPMGCTLLILASSYGHYDSVKFLLDNKVDINVKNIFQNTALLYASKKGHASIVDCLLDNGANVNTVCMRSSTPLIEAASWGQLEIVEKLLCRYSSVNACDDENMNALTKAAEKGHHQIVQKLLENKAAANIRTHKNETALMIACRKGNLNIVTILINHIVDCSNNPTILYEREHSTIQNENRLAFLQLPFELCSNLTTEVSDDINQAFLNAYRNAHVAIMKFLLDNGANVQAQLNNAVSKGEYIIVKLLLQNEAQVHKRANFGIPPLMLASSKGHTDIVKLLLKHGSSINSSSEYIPIYFTSLELIWIQQNRKKSEFKRIFAETDKNGTALIRAIQSGSPYELIKTLLQEKNIKINSQTYMGRTALMVACGSCQQKVVQLLLFYKANVSIKSKLGATALDIASVRELENENMIKDLLENGAIYSKDMIPYQEGILERPVRTLFSKIELDIWIISLIIILGLLTLTYIYATRHNYYKAD